MSAPFVLEGFDVVKDHYPCLSFGRRDERAEAFGFKGGPEGFLESIVITVAFTTHTGGKAAMLQKLNKFTTGELAAPIGMMKQPGCRSPGFEGLVPGGGDQRGGEIFPTVVADQLARTPIHDPGRVKPAFLGMDLGEISNPNLVRLVRGGNPGQPVGSDSGMMAGVGFSGDGAKLLLLLGAQARGFHQAVDTVFTATQALITQIELNPG